MKRKNKINESLFIADDLSSIISYLYNIKGDPVSLLLNELSVSSFYPDDTEINFIKLSNELNMLSYLPKKKRKVGKSDNSIYYGVAEDNFQIEGVKVRIGRIINKIIDNVKDKMSFTKTLNGNVYKYGTYGYNYILKTDLSGDEIFLIYISNKSKINIKCDEFEISGYINYYYDSHIIRFESNQSEYEFSAGSPYYSTNKEMFKLDIKVTYEIKQSDVENFVNELISLLKENSSSEDSKIEVVTGKDISYWYDFSNYQSRIGKLGNSCMSEVDATFFDIYTKNENCSMLILKNKNNKLIGRAILWKTTTGEYFMDRVYTTSDNEENIFYNYAIKNDYIYRTSRTEGYKYMRGGKVINKVKLYVSCNKCYLYPYLDTLYYIYNIDGPGKPVISNVLKKEEKFQILQSTEGDYLDPSIYDYDDEKD